MNRFAVLKASLVVLVLGLVAPPRVQAQFLDSSVGLGAGLIKLFEPTRAFTAQVDLQVLDTNKQEALRAPMSLAVLDGRVRMEFDMTQMRGMAVQPSVVNAMKQIRLNQVASVVRLDKRLIHVQFPHAGSYIDTELSAAEIAAAEKNVKVLKTALGQEKIANHPCTKHRVQVKNAKGVVLLDAITWNATDLNGFPVQIATQARDGTSIMRLTQVQMSRPATSQFEVPANFTKYGNIDMLLLAAAQKQLTGGSPKAQPTTRPAPTQAASPRPTTAVKPTSAAQKSSTTPTTARPGTTPARATTPMKPAASKGTNAVPSKPAPATKAPPAVKK